MFSEWGYDKSIAYSDKFKALGDLKINIYCVIGDVQSDLWEKVTKNWIYI